jgi:hypothetical protein
MSSTDKDEGWSWTLAPAIPSDDGSVTVMVFAFDGEFPVSYINHHKTCNSKAKELYEVDEWISDLWMTPSGVLYAAGEEGKLHVRQLTKWNEIQAPDDSQLSAVWSHGNSEVYVGNDEGIFRYENGAWRVGASGYIGKIEAIRGGCSGIYAVGTEGLLLHSPDGEEWVREMLPTNVALNGLCIAESGVAYAVGNHGVLIEGTPGRWKLHQLSGDLMDISCFNGIIYVGSDDGLFSFDGKRLNAVKTGMEVVSIRTSDKYLCISGETSFHRFDGSAWSSYQYSFT